MPTQDAFNLTTLDARSHQQHLLSDPLAEAQRQAAIAAEANRQTGFYLALAEAGRQSAKEAARTREASSVAQNGESKTPLAYRFRQWCLDEMHISPTTGYKYVNLGKIKIFRVGSCTMISDEESRRILAEGVR